MGHFFQKAAELKCDPTFTSRAVMEADMKVSVSQSLDPKEAPLEIKGQQRVRMDLGGDAGKIYVAATGHGCALTQVMAKMFCFLNEVPVICSGSSWLVR